ncbi:MAG: hypothetical protein RL748_2102 [Pseudomonadota bacterium]
MLVRKAGRFPAWLTCLLLSALWLFAAPITSSNAASLSPAIAQQATTASAAALPVPANTALQRWLPLADTVFQHWLTEHGLPHSAVTSLAQDATGFIWIGTQGGLARWDGYRFRHFKLDTQDPYSLPDNFVRALYVDPRGQLWVGTNGAGLARFDALQERFVRFAVGPGGISHQTVHTIIGDGANGLWVGTWAGLNHLALDANAASGAGVRQWQHAPQQPPTGQAAANPPPVSGDTIRALLLAADGRLWLGTGRGMFYLEPGSERMVPLPLPSSNGETPNVDGLWQSADGRIWVGSRGQGAYLYDPKSGQARALMETASEHAPDGAAIAISVSSVAETGQGEVWFGTYGQGIIAVDMLSLRTRRIQHDASVPTSLLTDRVWAMLRDRAGLLWVGTQRGLTRHNPNQPAFLSLFGSAIRGDGMSDAGFSAVMPMSNGKVWLGAGSRGVNIIDPASRQVKLLRADGRYPEHALPQVQVHEFAELPGGRVLIATGNGLYLSDADGEKIRKLHLQQGEAADRVHVVHVVGKLLWLAGEDGVWQTGLDSLSRLSANGGLQVQRPPGLDKLPRHVITALAHDQAGQMWIGTHTHGLYRYDPASRQLQPMPARPGQTGALQSNNVASIFCDARGWVWVATQGGGVSRWQAHKPQHFDHFGISQGLSNEMVNKVLEDDAGRIWLSTDDGLAMIAQPFSLVRMLQRGDGVAIPVYWSNAGAKTAQGELLFGGNNGLTVVRPALLRTLQNRPLLALTSVQVGGKLVAAGRFNPGHAKATHPATADQQVLQIPSDANSLVVEFARLDFVNPAGQRYGYKLEGFDRNWIDTDASRRLAAYTNLPPGEYRLRLRARGGDSSNGSNSGNSSISSISGWHEPERELAVRVLPAWYQTIWFYGLLGLALLGLVLAVIQVRTAFLRQRQHELELQVQQRTRELQQKQGELVAANTGLAQSVDNLHQAQAQLVQQEKLASLGGLVAGVAHEINTPLGTILVAISGVADIWQRLQDDMAAGRLSKSMLEQANVEGQEYTALALRSASRAAELIDSFKAVAVEYESDLPQSLDLLWYLPDIAMLVRSPIELGGHKLELEVEPDLIVHIVPEALTEALTRVLANVLDHAFDLDMPGRVCLSARHEGAQHVLIEVSDNGCGIAPENLPKVFDPFFSTKSGLGGHIGLGLHVAYNQVAQRLKGQIAIHSMPGQGTRVSIRLARGEGQS